MGHVTVNYNQMLAAKQVYKDVYEDLVDAVYDVAGHHGIVDLFERGTQMLVRFNDTVATYRIIDDNSKLICLADIMSIIVVGSAPEFVVDLLSNCDMMVTAIVPDSMGPMKLLLAKADKYGMKHLKVAAVSFMPPPPTK